MFVGGHLSNEAARQGVAAVVLPEGYRPASRVSTAALDGPGANLLGHVVINQNGQVIVYNNPPKGDVWFMQVAYMAAPGLPPD